MATQRTQFIESIALHSPHFEVALHSEQIDRLANYYDLLSKWNERLHLVAPCSPREFAVRHVLESLLVLKHLPLGAEIVDIGSGGGLPMVPCLLVRDDLRAVLIESSKRKAVFLRTALRGIASRDRARVIAARFQEINLPQFAFLTCRAIDRFNELLPELIERTAPHATLMLFTGEALRQQIESQLAATTERVPESQNRFLIIGRKP